MARPRVGFGHDTANREEKELKFRWTGYYHHQHRRTSRPLSATMRNGTNVYGRWIQFSDDLKNQDEANAEADRLWWVNIINPEGVEETACGGGITSAEAAAVTWINTCLCDWWRQPGLSEQDDANVPRRVPEGWQFELYKRPVRPVLTIIEGS